MSKDDYQQEHPSIDDRRLQFIEFFKPIDEYGQQKVREYERNSSAAQNEMHRYVVAGAGGGILLLSSQLASASSEQVGLLIVPILFFVGALYSSLMSMQGKWVDDQEAAANWSKWTHDSFEIVMARAETGVQKELPAAPVYVSSRYTKWSARAQGAVTGGGTASIFYLLTLPSWSEIWLEIAGRFAG